MAASELAGRASFVSRSAVQNQNQDIEQLARQAIPYLTLTDSGGNRVSGDKIGTIVIFNSPDMTRATGATTNIEWNNSSPVPLTPVVADSTQFTNATDSPQAQTIVHTYTDTKTFTWTLSEQIQLGVTDKGKANFLFAEAEVTVSFNFTLGSTQSWTSTETDQLTLNFPLTVPPHSIVTAKWIIQRFSNVTLPFTATFQLTGTIGLSLFTTVGQYTWSGSAGQLITAAIRGGATGWSVQGDVAVLTFTGTLQADEGVNTIVDIKQSPIEGGPSKDTSVPYSLAKARKAT